MRGAAVMLVKLPCFTVPEGWERLHFGLPFLGGYLKYVRCKLVRIQDADCKTQNFQVPTI